MYSFRDPEKDLYAKFEKQSSRPRVCQYFIRQRRTKQAQLRADRVEDAAHGHALKRINLDLSK